MTKVAAAVAVMFAVGAGMMTALSTWLGTAAEAAALGVVGVGLVGTSYLFAGRSPRHGATPAGSTQAAARRVGETA